jgi:hypothetical protein
VVPLETGIPQTLTIDKGLKVHLLFLKRRMASSNLITLIFSINLPLARSSNKILIKFIMKKIMKLFYLNINRLIVNLDMVL